MAILKVARLGHPVLREKSLPVPIDEIRSPEIQRLIDDLVETMREYNGAGLAAPQVHVHATRRRPPSR
jgi:peptide deformylase